MDRSLTPAAGGPRSLLFQHLRSNWYKRTSNGSSSALGLVASRHPALPSVLMARFTFLLIAACISYAAATVITREVSLPEDQSDEPELRTIYGNATVPWEEGEVARIRVLSDLVTDLEFNCKAGDTNGIPEVCVSYSLGQNVHILLKYTFPTTAEHVLRHNMYASRTSQCTHVSSHFDLCQAAASLTS